MSIAQSMLPEFDHEMATTRRLLERVPEAEADWRPHARSTALGQLAAHIGDLPRLCLMATSREEFDMAPPGAAPHRASFTTTAALLDSFDAGVREAREGIAATSDEQLTQTWALKNGGATVMALPRVAILRTLILNHMIHHRGQLSVYLRLRDVPLPSIYGPSADER
ncbi:MAG: DinB family protein [Gemmatimonadaceae bacterium]